MGAISIPYSVRAMSVATWSFTTETYGTPVSVANLQMTGLDPQHDTDLLKILGAHERGLSVQTDLTLNMSFGGLHWASLAVMTGLTDASSGDIKHRLSFNGGLNLGYFGAVLALPLDDGGDMHIYLPLCQLTKNLPLDFEQNQFSRPEVEIKAMRLRLADDSTYPIWDVLVYDDVEALPTDFSVAFGLS